MRDPVLVTGGTGKTGRRVAALLAARGVEARVASRTPRAPGQVRLDWHDPATFAPALDGVRAAWLVAPGDTPELLPVMLPFLERAVGEGVGQLVLLSASSLPRGGPMMGAVHDWVARHAPGWSVLRPSWFMQNFSEAQHLATIRDEGRIYSAAGDGRIPFIDASDIAAVAVEALLDDAFGNGERVLTGPRALTYDEAAAIIGEARGRPVRHHRLSVAGLVERFERFGIPPDYARVLASMDEAIAEGAENRVTDEVERVTGRPPVDLAAFARATAAAWS